MDTQLSKAQISQLLHEINRQLTRHVVYFIAYITIIVLLYTYNPYNIMTINTGLEIVAVVGVAMSLVAFIIKYYGLRSHPEQFSHSSVLRWQNALMVVMAVLLVIVLFMLYISYASGTISTIVFVILVIAIVIGLIKRFGIDLNKSQGFITGVMATISADKKNYGYLLSAVFIIIAYMFINSTAIPYIRRAYSARGGTLLIPVGATIPLSEERIIFDRQDISDTQVPNYNYAVSFSVYIDSFGNNSARETPQNIFRYGTSGNPGILYDGSSNSFKFVIWTDESTYEVLYTYNNVHLQKWVPITLNYGAGILDIFIDGSLVKSVSSDIPYVKYDNMVIGGTGGINGDMKSLVYFAHPISVVDVYRLAHI
jgi:hypothetical protein